MEIGAAQVESMRHALFNGDIMVITKRETGPTIIYDIADVRLGPDDDCIIIEVFE